MTHPFVEQLQQLMRVNADAAKAPAMQAYMKTQQPFYGIQAPLRKQLFKQVRQQIPITSYTEYCLVVEQLWQGRYREDMYQALEVAGVFKQYMNLQALPLFEALMRSASNWDTLDWIASGLLGGILRNQVELPNKVRQWRTDENLWVRRTSLLVQLKFKKDTDANLLAETIVMLAPEKEFFVRKAIGWVLREFSKTDPDWVWQFVQSNADILSGLSRREALKRIRQTKKHQGS